MPIRSGAGRLIPLLLRTGTPSCGVPLPLSGSLPRKARDRPVPRGQRDLPQAGQRRFYSPSTRLLEHALPLQLVPALRLRQRGLARVYRLRQEWLSRTIMEAERWYRGQPPMTLLVKRRAVMLRFRCVELTPLQRTRLSLASRSTLERARRSAYLMHSPEARGQPVPPDPLGQLDPPDLQAPREPRARRLLWPDPPARQDRPDPRGQPAQLDRLAHQETTSVPASSSRAIQGQRLPPWPTTTIPR